MLWIWSVLFDPVADGHIWHAVLRSTNDVLESARHRAAQEFIESAILMINSRNVAIVRRDGDSRLLRLKLRKLSAMVVCSSAACLNGKPESTLECPTCNKLGVKVWSCGVCYAVLCSGLSTQGSYFCSQDCFKASCSFAPSSLVPLMRRSVSGVRDVAVQSHRP